MKTGFLKELKICQSRIVFLFLNTYVSPTRKTMLAFCASKCNATFSKIFSTNIGILHSPKGGGSAVNSQDAEHKLWQLRASWVSLHSARQHFT